MRVHTLLLLCTVVTLLALVVATETEKDKVIAKTVFESKWVEGKNGKLIEQKTPKKQLFKVVQKPTSMPDPTNPAESITVMVPTEVPYVPNRRNRGKLAKLKERLKYLVRRENELKHQYSRVHDRLQDYPVLEDGAPAEPDAQMKKMAQDLYGELQHMMDKAKSIRQDDLDNSRAMLATVKGQREDTWKLFDEMKEKMLVPSHAWSMHY